MAPSARNRPAIDMPIIWPRSGAMLTRSCGIKTTQTMESGDCVKLGLDLEDVLLRRKTVYHAQKASKGHFPQRKSYRCQGGVLITSKPLGRAYMSLKDRLVSQYLDTNCWKRCRWVSQTNALYITQIIRHLSFCSEWVLFFVVRIYP